MLATVNQLLLRKLYFNSFHPVAALSTSLTAAFNSRPNRKLNISFTEEGTGLFGVPELQSHRGFYLLKDQCEVQSERLVQQIISTNRSRKIVEVFDELSDALCKVADLAEFIRIAHPSEVYAKAAETASATVSGIVEKLNTDRRLYSVLNDVVKNGDKVLTNDVDNRVTELFLFDFEQSGIHLPEKQRNKVVALNDILLQLGQHFVATSAQPKVINKEMLPEKMRHLFPTDGDNVTIAGLCADSSNPFAREMAYRIYLSFDEEQDYLLTRLLKLRFELAQTCDFPTYAHRVLKGSVLETPDAVMNFLNYLSDGLKTLANDDFQIMADMKQKEVVKSGPLAAWDTPYFTKKARKEYCNYQASEYMPYFSLGACMEGLNNLLVRLFGVSLDVKETMPGECWVPDVYKIAVTHETEGLLGYIYCDFYERSNKLDQDSHFTIKGGKVLPDGSYQHPIVVLMLNFPLPRWSSPTLLSPYMVDNLFHEMGHAIHSMLARTQYQHVTGTRCSTDLAEVPSVLMEYFANDVRVIKSFAKHFQTEKPIPDDMLQRLCTSKSLFTASELQIQVFYSALDQLYHGKFPLEGSTTEVLAAAQVRYYGLPYVNNTAWHLRFSHLVGYGAKYYSYMVSRALASCIWQRYFADDPFNRTQGERFRNECLAHGGGRHPRELVANLLQAEPTTELLVDSLLTEINMKQQLVGRMNL